MQSIVTPYPKLWLALAAAMALCLAPAAGAQDACAGLDKPLVRYDTAGKPFVFTIEYPEGWYPHELIAGSAASLDFSDEESEFGSDYVLRFGSTSNVLANAANLVETWRKMPISEELREIELESGRTMVINRTRMGEMVGFQVLLPDPASEGAFLVSGGITSAPDECRDRAAEVVEQMLASLRPNAEFAAPDGSRGGADRPDGRVRPSRTCPSRTCQ